MGIRWKHIRGPLLAVLVSILPLLLGAVPRGHDLFYELIRIAEFNEALNSGYLIPAWAENLYGGYGSPFFLFYAPLFYYCTSALKLIIGSYPGSMLVALVVFSALSAWTIYLLLTTVFQDSTPISKASARVGVYLYVLSPYLLCDKFLRNSNAEFAALCLLPLLPCGVLLARKRPLSGYLLTSMSLAVLVLSHNITAMTAAGMGFLLILILYGFSRREALVLYGSLLHGVLLSAFFWVPALAFLPLVRHEELVSGELSYQQNFVNLKEVFLYQEFYAIGLLTPLALAFILWALISKREMFQLYRRLLLTCLSVSFVLLFLLTEASQMLWEVVPMLGFVEFPWRLLGPLALLAACGGGLAFLCLLRESKTMTIIICEVLVFTLCVANALPALSQTQILPASHWAEIENNLTPQAIQSGTLGASVYDEFMPRGTDTNIWKRPRFESGLFLEQPVSAQIKVLSAGSAKFSFRVEAETSLVLNIARWNFPEWTALLNGEQAELEASSQGAIALKVPAGESLVEVSYRVPELRRVMTLLSVAALLFWLWLYCRKGIRTKAAESSA